MLLLNEYRTMLIDMLQALPKGLIDLDTILKDPPTVDQLWACFQKDIQDYDLSPQYALADCLKDCLNIDLYNTPLPGPEDWIVTITVELPLKIRPGETFEEAKTRLLESIQ